MNGTEIPLSGGTVSSGVVRGTRPWTRLWQEGHGDTGQADTEYIAQRESNGVSRFSADDNSCRVPRTETGLPGMLHKLQS